jgi:molecular chaperone HtpG
MPPKMTAALFDYPQLFAEKLSSDPAMRAAVDLALSLVSDLLQVSKVPFFPDYTDHGAGHLTRVLGIADRLIPDRTREVFTTEDAAVLIFSALLHDLALHLSEAGFKSLLNRKEYLHHHKSSDWATRWREFLTVAKHWDDRKLVELFGADEAGAPRALVRDPFVHYDNLTESDRKLIGEFIRQYHAQMAYEFAVLGFPGSAGQTIQFSSFDTELKELAGIVARSHGFALRDCLRHLEERQFNKLEQDNVHPVFLMGILRVADFLELGTDRSPLIAFAYKDFKSPVSQREWRTNQSFRRISWGNPDPESIHIPATPTDVYSYLDLKGWLTAIQAEIDMTWAVFGEVYTAHPRFSKFALTIRRVRSTILDDPERFARNTSFVPKRIELGVVGADILKLFIEPLYGRHPEIGIRELIQNAVDAVRERREFERIHPHLMSSGPTGPEPDVVVWLDDPDENGLALLTIKDNGIGMTEETVANYFLKAGASFRRSVAWKKEFESENRTDEKAELKSRVLRSGRFGIGVLAAFLLGDEIEVSTRHITCERGVRFSVRLDLHPPALEIAPIQLTYDASLPIGTTVKLKVSRVVRAKVEKKGRHTIVASPDIFVDPDSWDWYCLETPSVKRLKGKEKRILKRSATVPAEDSVLPRGWYVLQSSDFRTVHALAQGVPGTYAPDLVCNGIKVRGTLTFGGPLQNDPAVISWKRDFFPRQGLFRLYVPDFSISDPDGNLPLNLQRTGLTHLRLDFLTEAFAVQSKVALATFLLAAPAEPKLTNEFLKALTAVFQFEQTVPVCFTKIGTALLTATNLRIAQLRTCLLVNFEAFAKDWLIHVRDRYDAMIVARWSSNGGSPIYSLNELSPWIASARVITRSREQPVVGRPLRFRYKEFSVDGFHIYRTGNCSPGFLRQADIEGLRNRFPLPDGKEELRSADDFIAAELFLKDQLPSEAPPELSVGHYWEKIIREPVIPFNSAERIKRLNHAYTALQEYFVDSSDPALQAQRVPRGGPDG